MDDDQQLALIDKIHDLDRWARSLRRWQPSPSAEVIGRLEELQHLARVRINAVKQRRVSLRELSD